MTEKLDIAKKKRADFENHLHPTEARWFAVYTSYKREKIAFKDLTNSEIETYLPLQQHTRRYVRKVKEVELPLISHYVFVKIKKSEYVKVLQSPYVVKFVKFSNNLISIPENEIELIKRILGEGFFVEVNSDDFNTGDEVEVIGGKLTGLQGVLLEKENSHFLSVELKGIGLSLKVSIAPNLLRKVNQRLVAK